MSKYDRAVLNAVASHGSITVAELARLLDVSDQTIRRIVKPLVESSKVRKVHGAIVGVRDPMEPPFLARMNEHRREKTAIARAVAERICDGELLAIDTGSTSGFVAQALRVRSELTIVTNSAFVASTLAMIKGNRVFMAGTQLRDHDGAAFDKSAFDVISAFRVDHAILSVSEIDPARGLLVQEQCEADIAAAMAAVTDHCILAVDHTKFGDTGRRPCVRLGTLSAGTTLVTDRQPDPRFSDLLEGFEIHIA